ncbi:MAG: GIY-YIG nuclease family protein [Alphaproteobacteria bacterium]|nr:GIY-YIG nuclease family protein [Alphaproteobacteria bacterium]
MIEKTGYIYLLGSREAGTLYLGVTSDLIQRIAQHKAGIFPGFTKEYSVYMLLYYEECGSIEAAILREKQVKKWKRAWKIRLIEETNPHWDDLYPRLVS